jgi:RNA polymerase sigma-70 factor (ECF subfamily)
VAATGDNGVSTFFKARSRMLKVAQYTLGNAVEAEDIVQDAWIRWQNADREEVRNAPAFLTKAAVRLAINKKKSARTRHETSLEPLGGDALDPAPGPELVAERGQALEAALLLLLEKLTPTERAAYLLREAFDYDYPQIARVIGSSEVNSRQLVKRARKHLAEERRAKVIGSAELRRMSLTFLGASRNGACAELEAVLYKDIDRS